MYAMPQINTYVSDKRGRMVSKRGKMIRTEGVDLPEGNIGDIQDSYKYLGIPQANGNHEEARQPQPNTFRE